MDNRLIRKGLVFGVIFLFLGLAVQPITSVDIKKKNNSKQVQKIEPLNNINPREYLFDSIILISNNPEIKELITKYKGKIFTSGYNSKDLVKEFLINNPDFVDEAKNIITNDIVLSERLSTLELLNMGHPIICAWILNLWDVMVSIDDYFSKKYENNPLLLYIFKAIVTSYTLLTLILWGFFDCSDFP